ncbi:hypothetical protein M0802_014062 [Mischocyttarus mexicanus]|nr:hypothetical protein M0802_014708 [Mischocyttarus mexicanus]KAI4480999.1 hypothetical protein M0802_014062 [Mischocyttarus mexicanus]
MSYQHLNVRVLWCWRRSERVNDEMTMVELTCEMMAVEMTFDEMTTMKRMVKNEMLREWMRRMIENEMTLCEMTFFDVTSDETADEPGHLIMRACSTIKAASVMTSWR